MLTLVLALNAISFAMGFHAFYMRREIFGKVLVLDRADRDNSAYAALAESGRFMGGFNIALCALNVMLLLGLGGFETGQQWAVLLLFNALAHGSQFADNIPMAFANRRGGGLWNVFKGMMLRIFVIDFTLMIFNAVLAAAYWF